ncbi:MAG: phosphoesterase [Acidocella sp.]|nr:phosphoesterase [Acidocella sp.]
MTAAPLHYRNQRLMLDPSGAAFWPARRVLFVADLHLETSIMATRGTLEKLNRLIRLYRPAKLIVLGGCGAGRTGGERLSDAERARLTALSREAQFIWVNSTQAKPDALCETLEEYRDGPFTFRHQASARLGPRDIEISGYFNPLASIDTKARRISRPCFVTDSSRLILPAFGAPTGGIDVRDASIAKLFPHGLRVFLLGQDQLFSFALGQLGRMAEVA